jgi:hypothetical protein
VSARRGVETDNASLHSDPKLLTPWPMEKQCSAIFTHEVFKKFQEQLLVARDHCIIQGISESEDMKIVTIRSLSRKERVVQMNKSNMFGTCSCKFYESYGIRVVMSYKSLEARSLVRYHQFIL